MNSDHEKLESRFSIMVSIVLVAGLSLFTIWNMTSYGHFADDKALTEARMLDLSIRSSWDYLDASQDAINYNSDGSYDFKHIYCAIAGKKIAERITRQSGGYVVRYARENPRSGSDEPDAFEKDAIAFFEAGSGNEYYRFESYQDMPALRYASELEITDNCLQCHGQPAGTKDETGFLREGMEIGDLAGITSIVIPLSEYNNEASSGTLRSIAFFAFLTFAAVAIVRFGLRRWVKRPLEEKNEKLAEANRIQSDFLASMSHELRTPLTSIIAFTDIWEKETDGRSKQEEKAISEIKQNSIALLNMVNNTIDAAKIDAGLFEVHIDEVDVVDVIDSSISMVDGIAKKEDIRIERDIDPNVPIIQSDQFALQKILVNLLSNAIRYSEAGSTVTIKAKGGGDKITITVRDRGCGIDQQQQAHIFEKFKQSNYPQGGSGLGLYLVDNLTHRLNGEVRLESSLGKGSSFSIVLPISI